MELQTKIHIEKLISKQINPYSTAFSTFKYLSAFISLRRFKVYEEDLYVALSLTETMLLNSPKFATGVIAG